MEAPREGSISNAAPSVKPNQLETPCHQHVEPSLPQALPASDATVLENVTILDGAYIQNDESSVDDSSKTLLESSTEGPTDSSNTTMEAIPLDQLDDQLRQLLLEVGSMQGTEPVSISLEDNSDGGETLNLVYHPATQTVLVEMNKALELQRKPGETADDSLAESSRDGITLDDAVGAPLRIHEDSVDGIDDAPPEIVNNKPAKLTSKSKSSKREKSIPLINYDDPFNLDGAGGGFADALASIGLNADSETSIKIACEMYKKYRQPRRKHILKKMSKSRELMTMSAPEPYLNENDPGIAPTFHNYCKGSYKINFALVADRIESELVSCVFV